MGADVVSGGELFTAMSAGFPADRIYFHGNNKTQEELEYGLKCGVRLLWWITSKSLTGSTKRRSVLN